MKITDKMRLDWVEVRACVVVNPVPCKWSIYALGAMVSSGETFRQAIDAAIRANPKKGRSK